MTWLKKIFGGSQAEPVAESVAENGPCTHETLVPMWDDVHEMGEMDKVTRYRCQDCNEFLPATAGSAGRTAA